jgi:hypothetical protein
MFSDYLTLGIPYRNEKTLEKLSKWDIDFQITTKGTNLLQEDDSRNTCLNYLKKHNCDFIWYLDGDEEFTVNQIENILEFIKRNPDADYYSINFKNLTIHEHLFIDYTHERIFRTDKYSGISHYYFDNQLYYNNGMKLSEAHGLEIPKNVAYIKHYSWLSDDTRTIDKIPYQRKRYCGEDGKLPEDCRCQYEWNHEKNIVEFSKVFHECRNVEIPILREVLLCQSHEVTIRFSRQQNTFHFEKVQRNMNVDVEIYDGENGNFLLKSELNMLRGVTYFVSVLSPVAFDKDENFYSVEIKLVENNQLIHNEKMHLKLQ